FQYEAVFATSARQRGLPLPMPPRAETLRTIYFFIGVIVVLLELARIWGSVYRHSSHNSASASNHRVDFCSGHSGAFLAIASCIPIFFCLHRCRSDYCPEATDY